MQTCSAAYYMGFEMSKPDIKIKLNFARRVPRLELELEKMKMSVEVPYRVREDCE